MARKTPQERIADLERQHAQIKARLNRERAKITAQKRKDDTRRKIIAGAALLAHANHNPAFKKQIWQVLNTHVTQKQDRALLGLDAERVDQK